MLAHNGYRGSTSEDETKSASIFGNSERGRMEMDEICKLYYRAPEPGVETQRQDAQFFLPCARSLSICSAWARSSSDALAIARS